MKKFIFCFLAFLFLQSCESVEVVEDVVFDYTQFSKLTFLCNTLEIKDEYTPTYEDPFVDHLLTISPSTRVSDWVNANVKGFGVENKLVIIIKEASITSFESKVEELLYQIFRTIAALTPSKNAVDYWLAINKSIMGFSKIVVDLWKVEKVAVTESVEGV